MEKKAVIIVCPHLHQEGKDSNIAHFCRYQKIEAALRSTSSGLVIRDHDCPLGLSQDVPCGRRIEGIPVCFNVRTVNI